MERGHRGNFVIEIIHSFGMQIEIFPFFPKRNFLSTRRRKRDVFMVRFDWVGSKGTWYDDVVSQFITAFMPLFEKKREKRLIRLISSSPHGCETSVFNRVHLRTELSQEGKNIGVTV